MIQVLIVSNEQDLAVDLVVLELGRRGVEVLRCNTERLAEWRIDVVPGRSWQLRDPYGRIADSNDVRAVWWRRPEPPIHLSEHPPSEREVMVEHWQRTVEAMQWTPGARWYSRPAAVHGAEDKARQLSLALELGFRVPDTVWSNDPASARDLGPDVVLKPVTAAAWDRDGEACFVFAHAMQSSQLPLVSSFKQVPAAFQRPVSPKRDVRVTVVDGRCMAAEHDPAPGAPLDWRLEDDSAWIPIELPDEDARRCATLVRELGLRYGAIDLVRDASGALWFLEINANGEWGWLHGAGVGVVDALCDALAAEARDRTRARTSSTSP